MKSIILIGFLLNLSSCSFLLSPPAIAVEEEIALEAVKIIEQEVESEFKK
jgi:hypothetical protein